jgi:hypothetical protein
MPAKSMPKIPTGITQPTPFGHAWRISYAPPDAHAPPTSMTARIDSYTSVRQKMKMAVPSVRKIVLRTTFPARIPSTPRAIG